MNESRGWKMFITFDTYESQKSKQMIRPQTTSSELTYKHYKCILYMPMYGKVHVLDRMSNLVQYVVNQYDKLMSAFFDKD